MYYLCIKFYAGYRFNRDKDRETITDLGLSLIDQQNSYNLKTIENIFTAGANYHYDRKNGTKKLRTTLDINLPLSVIDRKTDYARSVVDTSLVQAPVFFEPSLSFSHIKWRGNNISSTLWSIKASTSLKYNLPVATQLIAIPLTTDRINVYQGNAHLKSPATWNSNLSWSLPTKSTRTYLQQSLTYANYINL